MRRLDLEDIQNIFRSGFGVVIVIVLMAVIASGCGMRVVEDGQTGIKADFGKIADEPLNTGMHFYLPMITWIEIWNTKTMEIKETALVPSSEGLISSLDVSVLYHVPKERVIHVRKNIGRNYKDVVLEPYIREAIRNVVSGYEVKALFNDQGRNEISKKILTFLQERVEPRGIILQDVLLRDVRLPDTFTQSIQMKLKTEQEALQKQFELQKAKSDAEIEVARANGVAQSNKIISGSIDETYLHYLWITGLQKNEMQVIYVPTEANIPIMEAGRFKDGKLIDNKK
jgi:regulator of protease activity HflC (stomatin/prohibitin superfamily)